MRLRLDPELLDGGTSADFPTRTTTMGVVSTTPTWAGQTRIVPGDPMHSLLAKLITNRGTDNPVDNQMPPIASLIVDPTDTQNVLDWIAKMPPLPGDAGPEAAVAEAGAQGDAGTVPEGGSDAGSVDAANDSADGAGGDAGN
jgi:hypothetical protein